MPRRIVAMTQFRDFVLIACEDGSMWRAVWSEAERRFVYHRETDFPPARAEP